MSFNRQYQLCRSPNDLWMIMILPHQNGVYPPAFDADSVGIGCIALITRGLDLMRLIQKRATILLCSVAVAAFATSAFARPVHHHHHHHHHRHAVAAVAQTAAPSQQAGADRDMRYPSNATQEATDQTAADTVMAAHRWPTHARKRSRMQTPPLAASPTTRWCPRRASISAATQPGAAAYGAAPSWTWCSSAPATPAAATSPVPMRVTARAFPARRSAPLR